MIVRKSRVPRTPGLSVRLDGRTPFQEPATGGHFEWVRFSGSLA